MLSVYDTIVRIMTDNTLSYHELEHEPVKTCKGAQETTGIPLSQGLKNMLLQINNGERFVLVICPADVTIPFTYIMRCENTHKVRLANPDQVCEVTGVPVGCVPPFGSRFTGTVYWDSALDRQGGEVAFNPGRHDRTIVVEVKDLPRLMGKRMVVYDESQS